MINRSGTSMRYTGFRGAGEAGGARNGPQGGFGGRSNCYLSH